MGACASLPMYDLPELRAATDAWWAGLARALRAAGLETVPDALTRQDDHEALWREPELLFSQTCGYPLTHAYRDALRTVATPVYDAPGCEGCRYSSVIVVRAEDPAADLAAMKGKCVAVNSRTSHSGCNALRRSLAPLAAGRAFFSEVVMSGGHGASLQAVAEGRADVAAVDCVTYALIARHRPNAVAGLRVLAFTEPAPGLPYVTAAGAFEALCDRLRAGLSEAMRDPTLAEARAALLIAGIEVLPPEAYDRIDRMEREAAELGYPEIV